MTRLRCISEVKMPVTMLNEKSVQIERVVHKPKHSDLLVAEFWHDHSKLCFAYTVNGKPYIQLGGGQLDLQRAKATGVALDLAYDWLMEQVEA